MTAAVDNYRLKDRDMLTAHMPGQYTLRVKDLDDHDRPREKLLTIGPHNLSMVELLAVLWGVGTKKEDVLAMAQRTLREYGERAIGVENDAKQLAEVADIPIGKACQIVAGLELGRRFYGTRQGRPMEVRTAKQAHFYLREIGISTKEQLRGLYLNTRYQVIHDEVISIGSLTSNIVHPREVFQPAIERGAVAVIIAHNHPSGRTEPSVADIQVTEQLVAAGELLGIDLLDHLVLTEQKYVSIMEFIKRD